MGGKSVFYQLIEHETSTYTYLVADPVTREAALIDPVLEMVERDLKLIEDLDLKLKYVLDTHVHADHITGAGEIRARTGARSAVSATANVDCVDIHLHDGQELPLGNLSIRALATPGHTDSCMSFVCDGRVFTGDALLIRGTGRTDFQQGSSEKLYRSIQEKLFTLPDDTSVYPGHDYRGQTASTVGLERRLNPRVGGGRTKEEFARIMSELKLAEPKRIHEAVPANLVCGRIMTSRVLQATVNDGLPETHPQAVHAALGRVRLIDVRSKDEFNGELGHIAGAELVTLGPELLRLLDSGDRNQEIVFVCRSGGRSGQATAESLKRGYNNSINMIGGMLKWNELRLPVTRR